jgi:hypothetical protein
MTADRQKSLHDAPPRIVATVRNRPALPTTHPSLTEKPPGDMVRNRTTGTADLAQCPNHRGGMPDSPRAGNALESDRLADAVSVGGDVAQQCPQNSRCVSAINAQCGSLFVARRAPRRGILGRESVIRGLIPPAMGPRRYCESRAGYWQAPRSCALPGLRGPCRPPSTGRRPASGVSRK